MSKLCKWCGGTGVVTTLAVLLFARGCSPSLYVGVRPFAGHNSAESSHVLLSATNRTSQDYFFSCFLEIQTKSGWSDVSPSDDIRTLRYFRKGQVVQLEVGLPPKEGVYRFRCFYEPFEGTTWSTRMYDRLMAFKLPGTVGVRYRELLGRLQPWPKCFYSRVFENKAKAQPPRSSQQPPPFSFSAAAEDSLLPGFAMALSPADVDERER